MERSRIHMRQEVLLNHLRPQVASRTTTDLAASACFAGDSAAYLRNGEFGDDIVIVAAYQTPLCKSNRGSFKDTPADDLLAPVLKAVIERTRINPAEVGDIVVGTVLARGSQGARDCRMAGFYAGFPETVPVRIVNRQCSSGLQAVADVVSAIKAGFYDIGIRAGVESMTVNAMPQERSVNLKVEMNKKPQDCLILKILLSVLVSRGKYRTKQRWNLIGRLPQLLLQEDSRMRLSLFKQRIVCLKKSNIVHSITGEETLVTISVDDGIRPNANLADMAKLKPAFKNSGTTTAGNSSQVSDGAAAVLLMKRSKALEKGLPILGVFRSFAVTGVDPLDTGVGPAVAIPAAVKAAGLEIDDIDLFEINEAFDSQFVYCAQKLDLDTEKVNVNGGAMALGHPRGATGAHCVAILLHEMKKRGKDCRFGVISMCIATGMGAAAVLECGGSVDQLSNAKPISKHNLMSRDAKR